MDILILSQRIFATKIRCLRNLILFKLLHCHTLNFVGEILLINLTTAEFSYKNLLFKEDHINKLFIWTYPKFWNRNTVDDVPFLLLFRFMS